MIIKPNPERLLKMQQSSKIFIMGNDGNILTTMPELCQAVRELDIQEKAKLKAERIAKIAEFKKRIESK